jgi:hypothetical protein
VNMVFVIPGKFYALEPEAAELIIGVEQTMLENLKKTSEHMKLLYIKGHLDGRPVGCMMVYGGANVNIMSLALFEKMGHEESGLK